MRVKVQGWQIGGPDGLHVFYDEFGKRRMVHKVLVLPVMHYLHFESELSKAIEDTFLVPVSHEDNINHWLSDEQVIWLKRIQKSTEKGISITLKEVA